ncbi:MAG: transposase [Rickettsiales bacterium]|jgi:hypothetical protein|nr:transposase [Rickettsiales bacterium]
MNDTDTKQSLPVFPTEPPPYKGRIRLKKSGAKLYALHDKGSYRLNGKVYHDEDYLGSIIDDSNNLYYNDEKGFFNFTLAAGYTPRPELSKINVRPEKVSLVYGDIWVFNEIIKSSKLISVLNAITSHDADTLFTLIANKLACPGQPSDEVANWYESSFAKVCYPDAVVSSSGISTFLNWLGQDYNYRTFTANYLQYLVDTKNLDGKREFPILLDSTGLQNDIHIPLTAFSNHNGLVNNEIRLIYVVDQRSGLPIYYDIIPGNIIDNSTLIHTINSLTAYGIDIKFIIMDAGYSSEQNLVFLNSLNIPYITRLNVNRNVYKDIILNYGKDIDDSKYIVPYADRFLHCKKIPYKIGNDNYFLYLMKDVNRITVDLNNCYKRYFYEPNGLEKINKQSNYHAKFILISNKDIENSRVLELYHSRLQIEQAFDMTKNNGSIMPLRVHSLESVKGHLLICFLSTIISMFINDKLKGTKLCSSNVFSNMQRLSIDVYDETKIVQVPTKIQKEIIISLNLESPYEIEIGNYKSQKLLSIVKRRKAGRPLGRKNRVQEVNYTSCATTTEKRQVSQKGLKKRGRPPKNSVPTSIHPGLDSNTDTIRKPGRPLGSKNRPKKNDSTSHPKTPDEGHVPQHSIKKRGRPPKNSVPTSMHPGSDSNTDTIRKPGRPKGSKNKAKTVSAFK